MDSQEIWVRMRAHRWVYTFSILATLSVGILIGSVVSYGVKGKEGQKSSDAAPLTMPSPQQLSNTFSQIAKQLEPSVVNINTESTIKNAHRRRGQTPDDDQGGDDSGEQYVRVRRTEHHHVLLSRCPDFLSASAGASICVRVSQLIQLKGRTRSPSTAVEARLAPFLTGFT